MNFQHVKIRGQNNIFLFGAISIFGRKKSPLPLL